MEAQSRYERAYRLMEDARVAEDYNDAAYWFGAALKYDPNYKDAKVLQARCLELYEQMLSAQNEEELDLFGDTPQEQKPQTDIYADFIQQEEPPKPKKPQKPVIKKASKPPVKPPVSDPLMDPDKRDKTTMAEEVLKKIGLSEEEAKQEVAKRMVQQKKAKKKASKGFLIVLAVILALVGAVFFIKWSLKAGAYNRAESYISKGQYDRALEIYEDHGEPEKYTEILESRAREKMERGAYKDALELLLYADDSGIPVTETMDECCYTLAKMAFDEGDLYHAWDYYMRLSTYDSSDEIFLVCTYEKGKAGLERAEFSGYQDAIKYLGYCEHHYEDAHGHFIMEISDKFIHFYHKWHDILGFIISGQQQIKSCAAAHGAKVNGLVLVYRMIAQEGGSQMLDGVHFSGIHNWFFVRAGHSQIESGNDLCAYVIFTGYIHARL